MCAPGFGTSHIPLEFKGVQIWVPVGGSVSKVGFLNIRPIHYHTGIVNFLDIKI